MSNRNPKIIAFYLPQFHSIPENDKWWGEGFTEWVNTKKAKPLFKGHQQPKEPLNENYYCLLDSKTQEWQAELAEANGIYGFCYYHYWFNGKLLLERPMENMLKNKNIKLPFCISWANEPWARTWDGKDKQVLMQQSYGTRKEWSRHFEYLAQFFLDDRYIKNENKPVMLIYRTENIPQCDEMIKYWDEECKKIGLNGIYVIETMNSFQKEAHSKEAKAVVEFEPMLSIRHYLPYTTQFVRLIKKKLNILDKLDYSKVWESVLNKDVDYGKTKFLGGFVSWDNTARKGKKGLVLTNSNAESFKKNFSKQYNKSKNRGDKYLFINAWNEWAEGTYLEPDKINKYKYIKEIKNLISHQGEI